MAKHVMPLMKAKRSGSIINVGSISSFIAQPAFVPYNTTKVTQLAPLVVEAFAHTRTHCCCV
jgi:short-subunit dehydrogenase